MISTSALIAKFQQALNDKWGYIWGTAGEKWTAAKQAALEKTTDPDREQGRKYGSRWIGHIVADCSGLFSWAFKQLGGYMYPGSDTMYRKYCADKGELKKGKKTDGATLKPGTAVFVWNGKKYSHVGLYIGGETVIEAMSTLKGVTTSKVTATKWTNWGELTGVNYNGVDPGPDPKPDHLTLRRGSKGQDVIECQTDLVKLGYNIGPCDIDGDYGRATEAAVKQFQTDHRKNYSLAVDGICGPKTWSALDAEMAKLNEKAEESDPAREIVMYKVTIPHLTKEQASTLASEFDGVIITEEKGVK